VRRCCLNDVNPAFKILPRTARKVPRQGGRAQRHDSRQGTNRLATAIVDECNSPAARTRATWSVAISGLGPTHGGWVLHDVPLSMPQTSRLSARASTSTQGRSSPPTAKLKTDPDTTRVLLQRDDSRLGPACDVHLSLWNDAQEVMLSLLAQRRGDVRRHSCAAVEGVLRQSREAPGQHLTSRKRGNSPPYKRYPGLSQTTSGPPAAGIMTL
jgi:hypothetical protein